MKVSLVVASGTHQGKVVPITGTQFLVGREAQCNLRPASQAISKKHCGILIRDGKVSIVDYGSTNGTLVNDVLIRGEEVPVEDGATVMIGPLDFTLKIVREEAIKDGTPFPSASTSEALAAVKAVSASSTSTPSRDSTPSPANKVATKPGVLTGSKEPASKDSGSKEAAALKAASKPPVQPSSKITASSSNEEDNENIAAMLLGMDDGEEVPNGSTVMEMPVAFGTETQTGSNATKSDDKNPKKATSREDMTNAANDILRKMRRRPT
ncbi:MAG: hypothetical protein C0467_19495 [Planctomycetaceae bacterium]|nr:hypothetical protein [Planctomycetaceae bacterium]